MKASSFNHNGKRILVLAGGFDEGAAQRVGSSVKQTQSYDEVWLCSGGGYVSEGMALGRSLSAARATVRVPGGFRCVSSCTIAFLGGFVRIIEPESRYIVHASSSFLRDDYIAQPTSFDCSGDLAQKLCGALVQVYSEPKFRCRSLEQLKDRTQTCLILDPFADSGYREFIYIRFLAFVLFPEPGLLARELAHQIVVEEVDSTVDLLRYYQEMLLSGDTRHVRVSRYNDLKRQFKPLSVYDTSNRGQDSRSWEDDFKVLGNSEIDGRILLWQSILTDSELTAKRQLIDYIKSNALTFGPASGDAIKILDAMVVCQIQTLCRLSREEAAAIGIDNAFDAN